MPTVNFYLKKPEKASGRSLIYLQFKFNGKKLVFSFGQTINPQNWNAKKQRVKSNTHTTADGKHSLNDLLESLQKECLKAYNSGLSSGIPSTESIKARLLAFVNQNDDKPKEAKFFTLLERFIDNEIKYRGKDKSDNTIKTYRTLKGHLIEFESIKKYRADFDTIDLDFYYRYVDFLSNRSKYSKHIQNLKQNQISKREIIDLDNNSISKDIQIIKVIMSEAVDLGLTNNLQFRHKKFAVNREETDAIYLKKEEIIKLYNFDFSNNGRLEKVRDLFVFGCLTGLRYSDYSNVKPENIVKEGEDLCVKMITQKTKELVIIPCHPIILDIFNKYCNMPNKLPEALSNQKFNNYIKEACQLAGLSEIGRLATNPKLQLWESVSSHTARRSYATNLYLEGFPVIDLMKITGHKTEKAFMKYIRISKLDTAKRLSAHMRKWNNTLLRVAG